MASMPQLLQKAPSVRRNPSSVLNIFGSQPAAKVRTGLHLVLRGHCFLSADLAPQRACQPQQQLQQPLGQPSL